ncbi:MAG: methylthioribose-phosphate isomerase, partial [Actinomycetota bacterium]
HNHFGFVFLAQSRNLIVIDQTQLPFQIKHKTLKTSSDATLAIQDMTVRGAGVIGNVAAFGVYLAARESGCDLAKIKTLSQQVSIGFALAPFSAVDMTYTWLTTLWLAVTLTIISGLQYAVRALRPAFKLRRANK